ncbi:MAG: hypothetical protein ACOYLX_11005 [Burkholderiaceae bacterium]
MALARASNQPPDPSGTLELALETEPRAPAASPSRRPVAPLPGGDQAARIRAFLRDPEAGIDALGVVDGAGRDALDLLDRISTSQKRLNELNQNLVPLIARLREHGKTGRFLRWFTGEQLEHELSLGNTCAEVEASAELGVLETATIRELIDELNRDSDRLEHEIAALEADIELGRAVASDRFQKLRELTGCDRQTWQRLSRRTGNLEATATALRLTQQQYGLAVEHSKTVVSRFEEVRTLLIPIWYQRMGFALFARRAGVSGNPMDSDRGASS